VQWEQHQPLKSSPSIQIRCLFIYLPLRACWDWSPGCDGLDIKGVPPTMGNLPWNRRVAKYQRCLATTLTEGTFGGSGTGLDTPSARSLRRLLGERGVAALPDFTLRRRAVSIAENWCSARRN
jgi:hypothetical protein